MATISRYQFMGSWFFFWLLSITGIALPLALRYLLTGTIRVQEQVDDAERLLSLLASRRRR